MNIVHRIITFLLLTAIAVAPVRASVGLHVRADHQPNPALLIGASQLMFHHEKALLDVARVLNGEVPLFGLVSNEAQVDFLAALLAAHDLPIDAVRPVVVPVQSMWVRDYGPLFMQDEAGRVTMIDPRYTRTELNPDDDAVPAALAESWDVPVVDVPLRMEGGHVLSNGAGLLIVSNALVNKNAVLDDLDGSAVFQRIRESLPFDDIEIVLPLRDEPTGHVDMFMAFLGVDRIAIARMDRAHDPLNATRLDAIAAKLKGRPTAAGPLRVERIDHPPVIDGIWRTYTNAALVDDVVLVPLYPDVDPAYDEAALKAWRRWFPDRIVEGIDARSLVARKGALHCISIPLPAAIHEAVEEAEAGD